MEVMYSQCTLKLINLGEDSVRSHVFTLCSKLNYSVRSDVFTLYSKNQLFCEKIL